MNTLVSPVREFANLSATDPYMRTGVTSQFIYTLDFYFIVILFVNDFTRTQIGRKMENYF